MKKMLSPTGKVHLVGDDSEKTICGRPVDRMKPTSSAMDRCSRCLKIVPGTWLLRPAKEKAAKLLRAFMPNEERAAMTTHVQSAPKVGDTFPDNLGAPRRVTGVIVDSEGVRIFLTALPRPDS